MESRGISVLDPARVRAEYKPAGISSDRELAERVGVRRQTISDALRGRRVSPDVIFRICLVLSIGRSVR